MFIVVQSASASDSGPTGLSWNQLFKLRSCRWFRAAKLLVRRAIGPGASSQFLIDWVETPVARASSVRVMSSFFRSLAMLRGVALKGRVFLAALFAPLFGLSVYKSSSFSR